MARIQLDMRYYRWVGYGGFVAFLSATILALVARQYLPALEFAAFVLLSLYLIAGSGTYTLDESGLFYVSRLGQWRISWDEITTAQTSQMGTLLLIGGSKRFVLAPPAWWPRSCRDEAEKLVFDQLDQRSIVPTPSLTADYRRMKNTRIRQSSR